MARFAFVFRSITSTGLQASKCERNLKGMILVHVLVNETGFPIALKRFHISIALPINTALYIDFSFVLFCLFYTHD